MQLKTRLFGKVYQFASIKEVLAKANEIRSGDILAGVAAESITEMVAAKEVLSRMTVADLRNNPVVPYEIDDVTRIIQDDINERIYAGMKNWSVSELREWILDFDTTGEMLLRASRGLTSEVIAAVCKLMTNADLIYSANKIEVLATCNTTIGKRGTLSARLQPNHTTDDVDGIRISTLEGLSYGIGDAVIGLNPVDDSADSVYRCLHQFEEIKQRWEIPTQNCVLAHVTTQMEAVQRGAPADMIFQSIAGSQKGNEAFGFNLQNLSDAEQLMLSQGTCTGPNVMYFETGQGAELSSEAHFGADQQTMESRCYGLARHYNPFLVNTVVGFIGPEYLYDGKQVIRAGLEDHFCGKMHGLPMGVDVCYTNHMKTDQNDNESLAVLLTAAGCTYLMGIPAGDDIMLMYQTTGYHDVATMRELFGKRPIREFELWCEKMGFMENGRLTKKSGDASIFLK
ncbi:ethanolamine ammonia-lyase subunit EutB [Pelagibaculum spongiae]|uniref:Ethanolamine ammonia-lyase large subunit n=1 Tax=Pelagibaculum spongiae TaxID=2080658 RepID=A0A2V1H5V0_9GAMM|nr:ethanolamine ammonia-lyase subunit EutB [Pelagibaculum spongiae]PVZ72638.1 ethanolamine ammonia lyase large subunit [Pelagibaculum spongiae]